MNVLYFQIITIITSINSFSCAPNHHCIIRDFQGLSMDPFYQRLRTLSPSDRAIFAHFGLGPRGPSAFSVLHRAFEHTARLYPHLIAAEHAESFITYAELDGASNTLAHRLIRQGLQPRQRVILLVQSSIPTLVAILAVLKAGCQYIPLDGGVVPDMVLAHIVQDTQAPYILCLGKFQHRVQRFTGADNRCTAILLDAPSGDEETASISAAFSAQRPDVAVDPTDGAYIIYKLGTYGAATMRLKL
jgi:non-ribosomal peptide synthetase component F